MKKKRGTMTAIQRRLFEEQTKKSKFNDAIKRGVAYDDLKTMLDDLKLLLESACEYKGHKNWLEFVSAEHLDPFRELEIIYNGKRTISADISPSSFKKTEFHFIYHYEGRDFEMTVYPSMFAPYRDSTMRINSQVKYLCGVWTDPLLAPTPGGNGLFSKLFKNKTDITTTGFYCIVNKHRQQKKVIYMRDFYKLSKIENRLNRELIDVEAPLVMFMLYNHSLNSLITQYCGHEHVHDLVVTNGDYTPRNGFTLIRGTGLQSKIRKGIYQERHDLCIFVKEDAPRLVYELAYGLMYSFEIYPDRAIDAFDLIGTRDEHHGWRALLVDLLLKESFVGGTKMDALDEHMEKIATYIDKLVVKESAELGMYINTIYDYIYEIITRYDYMTSQAISGATTIFNKRLEVKYYVLYDFVTSINKNLSDINRNLSLGQDMRPNYISNKIRSALRSRGAYTTANSILPSMSADSTTDNRIFGVTAIVEVQERGNGPYRNVSRPGSASSMPASLRQLSAGQFILGDALYLYSKAPNPMLKLNPLAPLIGKKLVVPEYLVEETKRLDKLYRS